MSLPHLWKNADRESIVVVGTDRTTTYELAEKDSGDDRMPKLLNNRYIELGVDGIEYYRGWERVAQKDPSDERRLPLAFRTGDYVEIVYHNRTEIYRESKAYSSQDSGRVYEEFTDEEYEDYYRGNGFRRVSP